MLVRMLWRHSGNLCVCVCQISNKRDVKKNKMRSRRSIKCSPLTLWVIPVHLSELGDKISAEQGFNLPITAASCLWTCAFIGRGDLFLNIDIVPLKMKPNSWLVLKVALIYTQIFSVLKAYLGNREGTVFSAGRKKRKKRRQDNKKWSRWSKFSKLCVGVKHSNSINQ